MKALDFISRCSRAILAILFCLCCAAAYGQKKPSADQVAEWRKEAEQGEAIAQSNLGTCYAKGEGVPQDYAEAAKWYCKAAEQGNAQAQCSLGARYFYGEGTPPNYDEAVRWWREAAMQEHAEAQAYLGLCYAEGKGVPQDYAEAVMWYRKAAAKNCSSAQGALGSCYNRGEGVPQDYAEAVMWYRKAAEQGHAAAQCSLGLCHAKGWGVPQDYKVAVKWYRMAAEQGHAEAQANLAGAYGLGWGLPIDNVMAYMWSNLASASGNARATEFRSLTAKLMTPGEVAEAQRLTREWEEKHAKRGAGQGAERRSKTSAEGEQPKLTGTGFLITRNGYLVTNHHVVKNTKKVRVQTVAGVLDAAVVRVDATSDLALLKVTGTFDALPVISSRASRLGAMVATVGFPNIGLQGFAPKLSKGDISSLSGIQDDVRYFQISVPVQPGNSGGALVDERGNVVGVVSAQLNQEVALASTGTLAQNVNFAVKSSYLLSFLEAIPEVGGGMLDAKTKEQKFEIVVDEVKKATVLIVGY
jgi:TPR repeat protein